MPRHPDPDLEDRILNAAQALWKRGGEKSLTMRAVARAAGTNTPAVYRRFKDRRDLLRALLLRTVARLRRRFEAGENLEAMAESYIEEALRLPHEYKLFYTYGHELLPKGSGRALAAPGVEAQLRLHRSAAGETAGGLARAAYAIGVGAVGHAARNRKPAPVESDPGRTCGGTALGLPGSGENAAPGLGQFFREESSHSTVILAPGSRGSTQPCGRGWRRSRVV